MPAPDPDWGKGTRDPEERQLLRGPQPRGLELAHALRIFAECVRGFRRLHFVGPCVTVFGSARFDAFVTGASAKGTWVRIAHPAAEGRLVRGFDGLDVGDHVRVELVHTDFERGFVDFARA